MKTQEFNPNANDQEKVENTTKSREQLQAEYEKIEGKDKYTVHKKRTRENQLILTSEHAPQMEAEAQVIQTKFQMYGTDWKNATKDIELVSMVAANTANQKALLNAPTLMSKGFVLPFEFAPKTQTKAPDAKIVTNPVATAPAKAAEAKKDDEVDMRYVDMALGTPTAKAVPASPAAAPAIPVKTFEQPYAKQEISKITYTMPQMEQVEKNVDATIEKLEKAKEESKKNLEAMGVKNLSKGLEAWANVKPRYKIALAVTLAGASLVTGTALYGLLGQSLSATTFALNHYAGKMRDADEKGIQLQTKDKLKQAGSSIMAGTMFALATVTALSYLSDLMPAAGEKASEVMSKIKEFFATATPEGFPAADPYVASDFPTSDGGVINDPSAVVPVETLESGFGLSPLPEYTVQPGDNLTMILSNEVISTIPGAENLTDFQKENMIQNMLKYAAANPLDADFATINQFANPNLIHPGDTIDLNKMREVFSESNYAKFGGDTLFTHAQTIPAPQFVGIGGETLPELNSTTPIAGPHETGTYLPDNEPATPLNQTPVEPVPGTVLPPESETEIDPNTGKPLIMSA